MNLIRAELFKIRTTSTWGILALVTLPTLWLAARSGYPEGWIC